MNKHISNETLSDFFDTIGELDEIDRLTDAKMKQVGSRKDHRFDSDGQIKASRGREANEVQDLVQEQLLEMEAQDDQAPTKK